MATISTPASGSYVFLGDLESVASIDGGVKARCAPGATLRLRFLSATAVRLSLERDGIREPPLGLPLDVPESPPDVQVDETEETVSVRTDRFDVVLHRRPCRLRFGPVANDPGLGIGWDGNEVKAWFTLEAGDRFFGLGEKTGDVDKGGREWVMWNSDTPAYADDTDPLYQSIPFVLLRRSGRFVGLYLHNSHRTTFNLGAGNHRTWSIAAERGPLDVVVMVGDTPAEILGQYTALTGRQYLPPKWALGYQQCRWSYHHDDEVRILAQTFRDKEIPADVVYLDIHHMDGYRVFTWHPEHFSEPKQLLADLDAQGFKTVVIVDPGVKEDAASGYRIAREGLDGDHFLCYPDGEVYVGSVWPGRSYFPDFSRPATRDWWGGHVAELIEQGVDGIWNDMNEPSVWGKAFPNEVVGAEGDFKRLRNLYGYHMAQATYRGLRARFPERRPFVLTRAGFAGEQRFAAVWTGDNVSSWEHLALGIRMMLGLGLSDIAFNGMDVGGFDGSPSPELFARWIQVGALAPLFRTHSAINTRSQEPWSFGEFVERIVKRSIVDRYRMLPHLYTLVHEAHTTGAPVWRPVWWHHPDDEAAYDRRWQHQFFVGEHLLAAPVIQEGATLQAAYLPAGTWLDLNTGTVYEGERRIVVDAPLDRLPLFLNAGGGFITGEPMQYVGEKDPAYLRVDLLPAEATGRVTLYEDDGTSFRFEEGAYRQTAFMYTKADDELSVTRRVTRDGYAPPERMLEVRLYDQDRPEAVVADGQPLSEADAGTGWAYEPELRRLTVRIEEVGTEQTVTVR